MSNSTSESTASKIIGEAVLYEAVHVVVTPKALDHYEVRVREHDGNITQHAVERVVINSTEIIPDGPIWFQDVTLDVGLPVGEHGDTAWIWT